MRLEFVNPNDESNPVVIKGFRLRSEVSNLIASWQILTDLPTMSYSVNKEELARQCFERITEKFLEQEENGNKVDLTPQLLKKPTWIDFMDACKMCFAQLTGTNVTWMNYKHPGLGWRYFKIGTHENTESIVNEVLEQKRERIISNISRQNQRVTALRMQGASTDKAIEFKRPEEKRFLK